MTECQAPSTIRQHLTHAATLKALREHKIMSPVRYLCAEHADLIDPDWYDAGKVTGRTPRCEYLAEEEV